MDALIKAHTHFDFISQVSSKLHERSPYQLFPDESGSGSL